MPLILPYVLGLPPTLLLLAWVALPSRSPISTLANAASAAVRTRGGRRILAVAVAILVVNSLECLVDDQVSAALGYDATQWVFAIEGQAVATFQSWLPESEPLFFALSSFYLSGFIALLIAPAVVWAATGQARALTEYICGFALNYVLVLPLYLFFPVREVAWSGLSHARPLLEHTWPGVTAALRAGSALDNCFPSLHVSCTATAAFIALRSGPRGLRWTSTVGLVATVATVTALGIHWWSDVLSGLAFGWLCARLGSRLGKRFEPGPREPQANPIPRR